MNKEYDKKGNLVYEKDNSGNEFWYEHNGYTYFLIHLKNCAGYEIWWKVDKKNNNKNDKRIRITGQEYKEIEFRKKEKEYLSRTKISRFELMEI